MTVRTVSWALAAWATATALICVIVNRVFALTINEQAPLAVVASVWSHGTMVGRAILKSAGDKDRALDDALSSHPDATLVYESVVGEGPILVTPSLAFAFSVVPGRDGLKATLGPNVAYLTPDDLLSRQAYDKLIDFSGGAGVQIGLDVPLALALFADRLQTTVPDLLERGRIRRFRVVRSVPGRAPAPNVVTADTLTDEDVRRGAIEAALYLARGVDAEGRFRYLVDAPTNRTLPGYDWPRHAGATYFLAQVAALSREPSIRSATLRAASWMRDHGMVSCGHTLCVGDAAVVDVGSTALAMLAFVQIASTHIDDGYAANVQPLAAFLRGQQRADGEFMHQYDRAAGRPIDVQYLYYSGEAAFALSRAHSLLGNPQDLTAAVHALDYLSGPGWTFFGSRYYFGEEHWTCQAMSDLWSRAPSPSALDFCLRWHAYGRGLQYAAGETDYDADGAYGVGPILAPRLTPVGSRSEAGVATLDAVLHAAQDAPSGTERARYEGEIAALTRQLRRSLALLLRHQFLPGPTHLMAEPEAVEGAMPGSEVDWALRIDYAQHAGSAFIRWLDLHAAASPGAMH